MALILRHVPGGRLRAQAGRGPAARWSRRDRDGEYAVPDRDGLAGRVRGSPDRGDGAPEVAGDVGGRAVGRDHDGPGAADLDGLAGRAGGGPDRGDGARAEAGEVGRGPVRRDRDPLPGVTARASGADGLAGCVGGRPDRITVCPMMLAT